MRKIDALLSQKRVLGLRTQTAPLQLNNIHREDGKSGREIAKEIWK